MLSSILDPLVDFDFILWLILTNCCDVLVQFDKWQIGIRKIRSLAEAVENCRFVHQDHRSVPVTVTNLDTFRSIVCHFDTLYLYLSHGCVNLRKLLVSRWKTIELRRQQNKVPIKSVWKRVQGQGLMLRNLQLAAADINTVQSGGDVQFTQFQTHVITSSQCRWL